MKYAEQMSFLMSRRLKLWITYKSWPKYYNKNSEHCDKVTNSPTGKCYQQWRWLKADVKTRIDKAKFAFNSLHNVWKSRKLTLKTKIRLYKSNLKSVLLYEAECWRTVKTETNQLNAFHMLRLSAIVSKQKWNIKD